MSAGRTTYGDLMRVAARHASWASIGLVTERIADRATAEVAFVAYREMFAAVRVHIERLIGGPRRIEGMAWSDWTSPSDRAALRLVDELARIRPLDVGVGEAAGQPVASWRAAAQALGAAGDLLATHVSATGLPRTPDAAVWSDGAVRAVGYAQVADVVGTLCSADRDLALRAGQAGVPWRSVARRLPSLDRVEEAARELHLVARQELGFAATTETLESITVARPSVRTGDPVLELEDRTNRLRVGAWALAQHPHRGSVFDLAEYAAAAVVLHTHLVAHADPFDPGPLGVAALAAERDGWASVARLMSRLGSPANVTSGVRAEVHALSRAAQIVFPLARDETGVHAAGPRQLRPNQTASLIASCRDIADSASHALSSQFDRGMVYIHARHLDGDRVTDSPELVAAKLDGRYVPASAVDVEPVLAAFKSRVPRSAESPVVDASDMALGVDPLAM